MVSRGIYGVIRSLKYLRWRGSFWWHKNRRRYGTRWHIGNGLVAALLLASIILPIVQNIEQDKAYALSFSTKQLVGTVNGSLKNQLTYDAKNAQYQFNKEGVAADTSLPPAFQKATTGTPKNKDSATYSLDVPVDMQKGVTYHDTNSQLSFSLVPKFKSMAGREVDGHLVYPLTGSAQAVYTLKDNGLKEDIVVPQATKDTMTFSYSLDIPKTLEAKVIPGGGGAIGIYSADPALFGDISFGSDADRQAVEKARENAEKTTLVFALPAPVIHTADGSALGHASARFDLEGNALDVIATGLKDLHVPISIDPSVVVTSTSDFQTGGNNEGMITWGNGIVGAPTGSIGAWTATTSFTTPRDMDTSTVVYNGYMYVMGGWDNTNSVSKNDVQYAAINANGTLGTWNTTTNLPTANDCHGTAAYNGYMYIVGGYSTANLAGSWYAPINANGTLGAWTATASLPSARQCVATVAYNGYVYTMGGYDGTNYLQSVLYSKITSGALGAWTTTSTNIPSLMGEQMASAVNNGYIYLFGSITSGGESNLSEYVQINADGTLGAWIATATFPTFIGAAQATVYNGYVYVGGGYDSQWYRNNVYFAPLNSDGSVGAWQTTTSFSVARDYTTLASYNGYIYVLGGRDDLNNNYNDVQYAPISSTQTLASGNQVQRDTVSAGSVGPWGEASKIATGRYYNAAVAYNGYIYNLGGYDGTNNYNDVQYAQINPNGSLGTWAATTSFSTIRQKLRTAAYNGYLYVFGGSDGGSNYYNDVQYAQINSNGTVGTWNTTTSFATGRRAFMSAAYNGYLYIMGGYSGSAELSDVQYAPFNANGTLGSWTTTTAFTTGRDSADAVPYNGYLYILGGWDGSAALGDVQFAPINSNGTIGTWNTTGAFATARYYHVSFAYDGNIYIAGGASGTNSSTQYSDVQYAPINANGTVGTWQTTNKLTNREDAMAGAMYNGMFYLIAGAGAGGTTGVGGNNVFYTKADPGGMPSPFATTTSLPAKRAMPCSVTYNGNIYEIGGNTSDGTGSNVSTVYMAALSSNGTVGTWTTTGITALPETRGYMGCTVSNGYIYIAGGYTGSGTATATVRYVQINSDGTLGSWNTSAPSMPHTTIGRTLVSAMAGNGTAYLYSVGGLNSVSSTDATGVYYAPLNASTGAVGSWVTASSLIYNHQGSEVTVLGSHIYVMGGAVANNDFTPTTDVEYTTIGSTGSLASWQATTAMPSASDFGDATTVGSCIYSIGGQSNSHGVPVVPTLFACPNSNGTISQWYFGPKLSNDETDTSATSYGGYLYSLGGNNDSANVNTVQYALVNSGGNGTTGSWNATNSFTTGRDSFGGVAYNGYLYVLGGEDATSDHNDVQYAPINANGTLGSWGITTSFTNIRNGLVAVAYNGYMYIMGGSHNTTYYNDVQYAPINANGTLGSWATTTSFTNARTKPAAAVYNGYLYISGGWNGTSDYNDVQYAPINANGTLGSWATTTSFTTGRNRHKMIGYNGYMYIIGGWDNGDLGDVQYAPINAGGTVGTWQCTSSFMIAREASGVAIYNGYLYMTGGYSSSLNASYNDVQYAPINADGTLGQWNVSPSFTTARNSHITVAYNGYLYVFGGSNSGEYNDVQYAPINEADMVGYYSKLIDLGSISSVSSITYNGVLPGGTHAIAYKGAGANGIFTSSGNVGTAPATSSACLGSISNIRYVWLMFTLDDSGAQQGGATSGTSSPAYITDFTVNYARAHPAPNVRLHLGKTLQQGSGQSPLDTCYP